MKPISTVVLLAALSGVAVFSTEAIAQIGTNRIVSTSSVQNTTSNYYFAKPNELTFTVDVIGMVQRPGRYEISNTINLVNLLALAGGGTSDASINDVRVTRASESEGRVRLKILRIDLEDLSKVDPSELTLQPGDVIQIQKSGWASFRDAFTVVVGTALITSAVAQVINASR